MNPRFSAGGSSGLTLIETLVGVALIGVIIALAAPSFNRLIAVQRLKGVNAQLITDLQFARTEAASRNVATVVMFDKSGSEFTCYAMVTGDYTACNCNGTPGSGVCNAVLAKEVRTVQIKKSLALTVATPSEQAPSAIQFVPATGRILTVAEDDFVPPAAPFVIEVSSPAIGVLRNSLEATGRPTTCSPGGSISGYPVC